MPFLPSISTSFIDLSLLGKFECGFHEVTGVALEITDGLGENGAAHRPGTDVGTGSGYGEDVQEDAAEGVDVRGE